MKEKMKSPIFILSIMVLIGVIASVLLTVSRINGWMPKMATWFLQGFIVPSPFGVTGIIWLFGWLTEKK